MLIERKQLNNYCGITMKKSFYLLAALLFAAISSAQAAPGLNLGIYGGLNGNLHNPDFQYPYTYSPLGDPLNDPNAVFTEADVNESEFGAGAHVGFIINYPINDMFTISGRLGYNALNGKLVVTDANNQAFLDAGYNSSELNVDIEGNLAYFEISPMLQIYDLVPVENLYFLIGPEFGIPITNELTDNTTLSVDGTNIPFASPLNGYELQEADLRIALGLGIGYHIEISDNIFITPEVSYRLAFTDITSEPLPIANNTDYSFDSWSANQLRIGFALTFGFDDEEEPVEETASTMDVGFNGVSYLDDSGAKKKVDNIRVEEVQYAELFPLVPYVFFDKNESSLSESNQTLRAKNQTGEFTEKDLPEDVLAVNKSTLDIIGSRMQKYPESEVTIVGTNDGKEAGGLTLSQKRADYAKAYLVSNYGIAGEKIKTEAQNLPDDPSSTKDPEGISENRRAEFYTKNPNILEPIILESESTKVAEPNLIVFSPYANSSDPVSEWTLEIKQSGKTLKKFSGTGDIGDISWSIQPNEIQQTNVPVDYNLTVENSKGVRKMASGSIPVEFLSYQLKKSEEKAGKTISKYSLVVFDFDSPQVSEYDQDIIDKYVLPAIKYNSTVEIYGYTDRIGTAEYNKKLAGQRAESVKKYISAKNPSAKYEVYSVGEEANIVNNDLPVGRQLSRTVQIFVITPNE